MMDRESLTPKIESLDKSDRGTRETQEPFEEPVTLPTEDVLDLHAFAPKEIPSVVEEYIEQCREAEILEVRLIHGKGTGTQRTVVQHLLGSHPGVISFTDAPPEAGGWGATIVRLRTQKASGGSGRSA